MGLVRAGLSLAFGLSGIARGALVGHAAYTLGLLGASRALRPKTPPPSVPGSDAPRIAALVVAHDEEGVIADCVESLLVQRYPTDRFTVFVVADNCEDATAERARVAGAVVLERHSDDARGKPAAVAFGAARIFEDRAFDAIALFDADNVVAPDFLPLIASRLAAGDQVVQGFVDAKNPEASWVASASAIGFWAIDGVVQRPRERLGLSASLMGTGFAATSELFIRDLAPAGSLTDDLEAGARLALDGVRVAYEPAACTLDEKPTSLETAVGQRQRWMQGRWATAERWLPHLVKEALVPSAPASLAQRLRMLDVAVQLVSPSLLFTATSLGALSVAELALRGITGTGSTRAARRGLALAVLYFLVPVPGIARQRPGVRVWRAYAMQPAYLIWSLPIAIKGWVSRRETSWARTERSRVSPGASRRM